ncbi:cytochrome P450 monooxygenase-like protein [Amniculicola lignicola CBS 123094]|uniref:Cytochrome P450 monooxygenase-like protein n=1 Tax=Amniculicola lignicola CBS 123094 TaxID=1392246 RepID=A0A6A5VXK4_9PLEO|nr:cytochrome P450 monooxygenase-like protein [Amniculicola lignicola CBS 123094]
MLFPTLLFLFSAPPITLILSYLIALTRNYLRVRHLGIPIIIRFIANGDPLWMMLSSPICNLLSHLPFTTPFISTYRRGWEARVRCSPHLSLGPLFLIVTPSGNWLKVADFALVNDILKRKDEFGRDMEAFKVLDIYGKSLATTEGADWNRHRKVAAVTFTEKNNELVWRESLLEASQMLRFWMARAKQPIRTLGEDTKIFTLNVLAAALYDKSYPFESREESQKREKAEGKSKAFGYRDSLSTILRMIVPVMVFGETTLREAWWLPQSIKKAGFAVSDFRTYITELIDEERSLISQGKQTSPNLVNNLVRACEEEDNGSTKRDVSGPKRAILTKDEIISDLFVFAFAGNDTTAITLTHILAELSAHPDIQNWISEELRFHLPEDDMTMWDFQTCTKLKRCWAVMYETLRLCHPISQLVKTTGNFARPLMFEGKTYLIPPKTSVENLAALQTLPQIWGEDNLTWNPKRFITGTSIENEILPPDTSDDFFPWAYGRLVCPGKRFSQFELVAAIAAIFRDHRAEPVPTKGESVEGARLRTIQMAEDIEMRLLSEMREPEKVAIRWISRESDS